MGVEKWFAYGAVVIGLVLALIYWRLRRQAELSERWPVATATIVSSEIVGRRNDKGRAMYQPAITYRYEVAGRSHAGTRIGWGGEVSSSSLGFAERIVARYPQGETVTVRYDPADPAEAVLDPGERAGLMLIALAGVAFAGIGLFVLFIAGRG